MFYESYNSTLAQKVISSTVFPIVWKLLPLVAAFVLGRKAEVCRGMIRAAAEAEVAETENGEHGTQRLRLAKTRCSTCEGGSAPTLERQARSKENAACI